MFWRKLSSVALGLEVSGGANGEPASSWEIPWENTGASARKVRTKISRARTGRDAILSSANIRDVESMITNHLMERTGVGQRSGVYPIEIVFKGIFEPEARIISRIPGNSRDRER